MQVFPWVFRSCVQKVFVHPWVNCFLNSSPRNSHHPAILHHNLYVKRLGPLFCYINLHWYVRLGWFWKNLKPCAHRRVSFACVHVRAHRCCWRICMGVCPKLGDLPTTNGSCLANIKNHKQPSTCPLFLSGYEYVRTTKIDTERLGVPCGSSTWLF